MSRTILKTKMLLEAGYAGSQTIYVIHYNSTDGMTFFNDEGDVLPASFGDMYEWDAFMKLAYPHEKNGELVEGVEYVSKDELPQKIKEWA